MTTSTRQINCLIVAALIVSLLLQSCVRKEIVKPEDVLHDTTKDITVYTIDKRVFRFEAGNYTVLRKDAQEFIRGNGRQYDPRTKFFDKFFEGDISFHEIEKIERSEKTTFGIIGDILSSMPIVVIIVFVIIFLRYRLTVLLLSL
ncbi:MAG TPA: hypothetical protein VII11_10645 [Bacteroidota bacterium]